MRSLRRYLLAATLIQLLVLPSGPARGAGLDLLHGPDPSPTLDAATEAIWGLELPSWALGLDLSEVGPRTWERVSPTGDDVSAPDAWPGMGSASSNLASSSTPSPRAGLRESDVVPPRGARVRDERTSKFAWQPGGGLGYALAKWATLTAGYRYHAEGSVMSELGLSPGAAFDRLERSAHEFFTSLRVDFHAAPLENLAARWSLPQLTLPGWLVRGH